MRGDTRRMWNPARQAWEMCEYDGLPSNPNWRPATPKGKGKPNPKVEQKIESLLRGDRDSWRDREYRSHHWV